MADLGEEVRHELVVRADRLPFHMQRVLRFDEADELCRTDLANRTDKKKRDEERQQTAKQKTKKGEKRETRNFKPCCNTVKKSNTETD